MYTHSKVQKISARWKRQFGGYGPRLVKARTAKDATRCAIHLLNPTQGELDDALDTALRDNFPALVIHTRRTFGKSAA